MFVTNNYTLPRARLSPIPGFRALRLPLVHEAQVKIAQHHGLAAGQANRLQGRQFSPVQVGSVGRIQIFDPQFALQQREPQVPARYAGVVDDEMTQLGITAQHDAVGRFIKREGQGDLSGSS